MKKMIAVLILFTGVFCSTAMAQKIKTSTSSHQAHRMSFYYYPSSNVYYDLSNKDYWYYDDATSQWVSVSELPTTVPLVRTGRVMVYHNDADVWRDNPQHLRKYKVRKNGQMKEKHTERHD